MGFCKVVLAGSASLTGEAIPSTNLQDQRRAERPQSLQSKVECEGLSWKNGKGERKKCLRGFLGRGETMNDGTYSERLSTEGS